MPNPNVKFCAAGCGEVAIGGNLASSNAHCREHWRELTLPECVEVEVIGEHLIASVDGRDVPKGERAWLHPGDTDIAALVYAGAVKLVNPAKAAKE